MRKRHLKPAEPKKGPLLPTPVFSPPYSGLFVLTMVGFHLRDQGKTLFAEIDATQNAVSWDQPHSGEALAPPVPLVLWWSVNRRYEFTPSTEGCTAPLRVTYRHNIPLAVHIVRPATHFLMGTGTPPCRIDQLRSSTPLLCGTGLQSYGVEPHFILFLPQTIPSRTAFRNDIKWLHYDYVG